MKIKLIILALIVISVTSEAKWSCFSKYDKMDDVRVNGCSTDDASGYRTFRGVPSLLVRTSNNDLEIYLSANEYVGNIEDIEVKFDNQPKEIVGVGSSTDNVAMFIEDSATLAFAKKIMSHKKLLVRFNPLNENPRTLEFNLVGLNSKNSSKLIEKIKQIQLVEKERLAREIAEVKKAEEESKLAEEASKLKEEENKIRSTQEASINSKITNGKECEMLSKRWEWNGSINEWQCL